MRKILRLCTQGQGNRKQRSSKKPFFNLLQKEDPFARRYMSWIGHSEFGMDYEPIFKDETIYNNHEDLNHWLEQWQLCYKSLQQYKNNSNVRFNCYENLCGHPKEWKSLLDFIGLESVNNFDFYESKKQISTPYDEDLYNQCKRLYKSLLKKTQ